MSRSNYGKPFYVYIGTSIMSIRCASNRDVIFKDDHVRNPYSKKLLKDTCDRMNREAEIGKQLRNCDVGTVEEQKKRFRAFCLRSKCDSCQFAEEGTWSNCAIRWAQLPYNEEK